jgi:PhnB protein
MPQLNAYLSFNGNCAEAMRFYERLFDAKLEALITYGGSPNADQVPAGNADRVMHAYLKHPDFVLMASDAMAGQNVKMDGLSLAVMYETAAEARRVFDQLAKGGTVHQPLEETFWAECYGMVVDRFGTPWLVNGGMKPMPA